MVNQADQSNDSVVKMGEWNKMKIKVLGDEVTTWINDLEMIKIKDSIIGKSRWRCFTNP